MKLLIKIIGLYVLSLPLAQAELVMDHGYVRGMPPGQKVTAGFMSLRNTGSEDIALCYAGSSVANKVEFHTHSHDGGVMRMRRMDELVVPAGETVELKPGQIHLMFMGLNQSLAEGDKVPLEVCMKERCWTWDLPVVSVLNE